MIQNNNMAEMTKVRFDSMTQTDNYNSQAFSITAEESRKLHEEYEINDCIIYLNKAIKYVGGNTTIKDAIEKLMEMTRFADEVKREMDKGLATTAAEALLYADSAPMTSNIFEEKI